MLNFVITDHEKIDPIFYDWGTLKWVANDNVAPGCEQSLGIVNVYPGRTNPEHWLSRAEELVYMLSGTCDIRIDGQWYHLTPGKTLYIPPGVKHELKNNGWEPAVYVASFSAS